MIINNDLRNEVYINNLLHGYWDDWRTLDQLLDNILGEVKEVEQELVASEDSLRMDPNVVYYKLNNPDKPEGAPTELSDIIIFVLDYFGDGYIPPDIDSSSKPEDYPIPIDIIPEYLEIDEDKLQQIIGSIKPSYVFQNLVVHEIDAAISLARLYDLENRMGKKIEKNSETVSYQLHRIIKVVLEFCYIYGIDIDKELRRKIDYNNSRPYKYRTIGSSDLPEPNRDKIHRELLKYPVSGELADSISESRSKELKIILFRRDLRELIMQSNARKRGR